MHKLCIYLLLQKKTSSYYLLLLTTNLFIKVYHYSKSKNNDTFLKNDDQLKDSNWN